jgi:Ca2+/Na+ antiporter
MKYQSKRNIESGGVAKVALGNSVPRGVSEMLSAWRNNIGINMSNVSACVSNVVAAIRSNNISIAAMRQRHRKSQQRRAALRCRCAPAAGWPAAAAQQ